MQWSILGGQASLMHGIARELTDCGLTAVTFDMRGVGGSSGSRTVRGAAEVEDVQAVVEWTHTKMRDEGGDGNIVILGSSAGAPIAGSALDAFEFVRGFVGIGYVVGFFASIIFGCHYPPLIASRKPKLFILGTKDEFTSPAQLQGLLGRMEGVRESHLVEGVGHFTLESPQFDALMADLTLKFVQKHCSSLPQQSAE